MWIGGLRKSLCSARTSTHTAATVRGERLSPGCLLVWMRSEVWSAWWRHARRDWKASPLDPATVTGVERRDDGWRFTLTRPSAERWSFSRAQGVALRVSFTGPREETTFARIDVMVHSPSTRAPKTLADAAPRAGERIRAGLREPRKMSAGVARLGKLVARVHSVLGKTRAGKHVHRRAFVVEQQGLIYVVETHVSHIATTSVVDEIEAMLATFRVL